MKNSIRFLATGDIHSDLDFLKNIEKYNNLNSIDYILLIGDISDKKNDFGELLRIFKNKPIIMVPGNHETERQLKILESKYNIHLVSKDLKFIHNDLVIFGPSNLNIGPLGVEESKIFEDLVNKYEQIKNVKNKLFLSHLPPYNTIIGDASPFPFIGGSLAIKVFLENFNVNLSLVGHIHESSGLEEIVNENKIFNVGKTSKIIEFDLNKKELKLI